MMSRSMQWCDGVIQTVDQRALPSEYRVVTLASVAEVVNAIQTLTVRGAPAIGAVGALAVALSARAHRDDHAAVHADAARVRAARPTAVNLAWAVDRVSGRISQGPQAVLDEALAILDEDEASNRTMATRAAEEIIALTTRSRLRILTHCNTGRLATVAWGTALGTIRELAERGRIDSVLAGETRPLLQGARLTTWELAEAGIPHQLCADSAGPAAIESGLIDCVVVGADRITARGDVANKIGTFSLAVAAARAHIPFIVVAPESTVDETITDTASIVVEERRPEEVTTFAGTPTCPAGTQAYNPAFDVTSRDLVTAVVTEKRTLYPAMGLGIPNTAAQLYARGWVDGTAGNVSARIPGTPNRAVITASGRNKGVLTAADLVEIDTATGRTVDQFDPTPSAEVSIHAALYRAFADCGAIVHAHPPHATVVATQTPGCTAVFDDFEIIKGLQRRTASTPFEIPVLENHTDIEQIAADLTKRLLPHLPPAILLRRHGATTWGPDLATALNRMESLEMLCALQVSTTRGV